MRPRKNYLTIPFLVAWALFAISMFVDAFEGFPGWGCAWFCMTVFSDGEWPGNFWPEVYYFMFTFPNVAMALSPIAVFKFFPSRRFLLGTSILSWIAALYVISFAVVVAADTSSDRLEAGYFLWVASFVIFAGEWMRQTLRLNLLDCEKAGSDQPQHAIYDNNPTLPQP